MSLRNEFIHLNFANSYESTAQIKIPFEVKNIIVKPILSSLVDGYHTIYYIKSDLVNHQVIGVFDSDAGTVTTPKSTTFIFNPKITVDNTYTFTVYNSDGTNSNLTSDVLLQIEFWSD